MVRRFALLFSPPAEPVGNRNGFGFGDGSGWGNISRRGTETVLKDREDSTYRLRHGRFRAIVSARWPREEAERFLSALAAGRTGPEDGLHGPVGVPGGRVFLKRHPRSFSKRLGDLLGRRRSPARRGFEIGMALERARVEAVRPLAAVEPLLSRDSFLVLEHVEGGSLRDYILERLPAARGEVERDAIKERLWQSLGAAVARLHAARARQRDLKAPNIMVREREGSPLITLVDLEGMECLRSLPDRRKRLRDLARLAVSLRAPAIVESGVTAADIEAFVEEYLRAARAVFPEREDLFAWVDAMLRWAERKEEIDRRRGRPTR